jgi:hypothetical protein
MDKICASDSVGETPVWEIMLREHEYSQPTENATQRNATERIAPHRIASLCRLVRQNPRTPSAFLNQVLRNVPAAFLPFPFLFNIYNPSPPITLGLESSSPCARPHIKRYYRDNKTPRPADSACCSARTPRRPAGARSSCSRSACSGWTCTRSGRSARATSPGGLGGPGRCSRCCRRVGAWGWGGAACWFGGRLLRGLLGSRVVLAGPVGYARGGCIVGRGKGEGDGDGASGKVGRPTDGV